MWHFCLGFGVGVYIGTYYDCKPYLDRINEWAKQQMPPRKSN